MSKTPSRKLTRTSASAAVVVLLLAVVAAVSWFLFFRDTSAKSVDSAEAAEVRQQAIDEATSGQDAATADTESDPDEPGTAESDTTGQTAPDQSAQTSEPNDAANATEPVQPTDAEPESDANDSFVTAGSSLDGEWRVDTSIGTFDDACLSSVCSASFVGFRINEELAGIGAKTVVGRSPGVSGTMTVAGTQIVEAEFVVDMSQLITDDASRTAALRRSAGGLETDEFPQATFSLTSPIELGVLPAEGATTQVDASGDLTVHGVTQSVTIPLTAESQAGLIIVFGSLEGLLLSDFDIPKPRAVVVVSVEDVAAMELQLFLSR